MTVLQEITAWLWLFVFAVVVGLPTLMLSRIVHWTYETAQAAKRNTDELVQLREAINALNRRK